MKITITQYFLALFFFCTGISGINAQEKDRDLAAVATVLSDFHSALASGNIDLAKRLLSMDAVILENGQKETRQQYIEYHLIEDIKFAKAVPSVRSKPEITIVGDVAFANSTSVVRGVIESRELNLIGAELIIFSRTPSGWIIRAIHWSSRRAK